MEEIGIISGADHLSTDIVLKKDITVPLGVLLTAQAGDWNILYMVNKLESHSVISSESLVNSIKDHLGEGGNLINEDEQLFNTAQSKALLMFHGSDTATVKLAPKLLTTVRKIEHKDLSFMNTQKGVYVGNIRSGMDVMDIPVYLNAEDTFSHHVLITATTGRGKSNLVKVMAASFLDSNKVGMLILDAHNEYYGTVGKGLKDFKSNNLSYYTRDTRYGGTTLQIDIADLKPYMVSGVLNLTEAQWQAVYLFDKMATNAYRLNGIKTSWIHKILKAAAEEESFDDQGIGDKTLSVLVRKLKTELGLEYDIQNNKVTSDSGLFLENVPTGNSVPAIINDLEAGKKAIIDTSSFTGATELIIGSIIMTTMFDRYVGYKNQGTLDRMPVISVVLEEAPRVLSMVSEDSENVFGRIAREGRKFKIGIVGITQLVSAIDEEILANLNTKIILGMEIKSEREKIVNSCAQDLSDSGQVIASLDKGEAIVSSIFTKFAVPVKVPLFEDYLKERVQKRGNMNITLPGGDDR